ncbi:thiol:disulfide interchange protein DsbA [Blochmannia endosymbiont of Colobopsis nipponica]|uniref:thiol:disulfide interchange protein DsbA n=1 Tax=Blochmannia endosymbiont of Colobopsis nipponica TaxID=2681987 RepID=UPI0017822DE7|nr:thiol:disulfide interchange protein DsbA [Blochmannia endosymbiont of Colobopsis nipponica]QOI10853.1 thiol:disulfide interchange protein DsbA [Blochmannia endosymbiont of Colobopsis nipponica]
MKKKILAFIACLFLSINVFSSSFYEGQQYIKLCNPVSDAPQLLEFFSFYCPHCYQFEEVYQISTKIKKFLPYDIKIVRYHVDFLGKMGKQLTRAWAVAVAMGIEDEINRLIFEAVHKNKNMSINSFEDIRRVFLQFGVNPEQYDLFWNSSFVNNLVNQQQKAVADFKLRGVPAIFVNGKYMIKNDALDTSSVDKYIKQFGELLSVLIEK